MGLFSGLFHKLGYVERDRAGNWFFSNDVSGFQENSNYLKIAIDNPIILAIISLRSRMYSQMKITHVNSNGKEIENSPYLKLLNKPNYFQSQEDFLFQEMFFKSATGTNLTYQVNALNEPQALYNLIPSEIDLNKTEKIKSFLTTKAEQKALGKKHIIYKLDSETHNLLIDNLIPSYDLANGLTKNSFMRSPSRLQGLSRTIQNIDEALKSKNVNLKMTQKYLVSSSGDGNNAHIQDADRNDITSKLGKQSVMISNLKMDAKHLVSDMKRLYLDEQIGSDAITCINAFGMSRDILNYFANGASTYENEEKAMQNYIQNGIQPDANDRMNSLSLQWGLFDKGEKLVASYDHLPVMQSIVLAKIETLKVFEETLTIGINNQTISIEEAKVLSLNLREKLKL